MAITKAHMESAAPEAHHYRTSLPYDNASVSATLTQGIVTEMLDMSLSLISLYPITN